MPRTAFSFVHRAAFLGLLLVAVFATTAATFRTTKTASVANVAAIATVSARATVRATVRASALRHTRLLRSIPLADSATSASPAAVQLWFSEKIELGLSRVRIVGADGKSVSIAPLTQDATKAGAPVVGRVPAPLADGKYTLHWTAASGDGHAVKGSFSFTIQSR